MRTGLDISPERKSMSPAPRSFSAPDISSIVRESICETTWKAMRAGTLALISPVMMFTDGLWVESIRWMPTARLI